MAIYRLPRMNALSQALDMLNIVIEQCESFKIGKTHDLMQRIEDPDYKNVYPCCAKLYSSSSKVLVSYVESLLIDACKTEIPDKCVNSKDGEHSFNDEMSESDMYCVYVVWR